jgi:hypothetical protein
MTSLKKELLNDSVVTSPTSQEDNFIFIIRSLEYYFEDTQHEMAKYSEYERAYFAVQKHRQTKLLAKSQKTAKNFNFSLQLVEYL